MIKIAFFGTPDFSVPTLKELIKSEVFRVEVVITQPDKALGRGKKISYSPIKNIALENNIPTLQPNSIKKEWNDFKIELDKYNCDIGIVIAFGQILPTSLLQYFKYGCLNLHASLLPRWRGAAPIQAALENGDTETGVCLMQMEEGLDTGGYYAKSILKLNDNYNAGQLHNELADISAKLLLDNLNEVVNKKLKLVEQDNSQASYAKKISKADEKINWAKTARQIHNKIRSLSPYPGAYCLINNKRLKILKTKVLDETIKSPGGQIVYQDKSRLQIACGQGVLDILEVQIEGKKKMTIVEFLNGHELKQGDLLQ